MTNRRSLIQVALTSCVALLLPWRRSASAAKIPHGIDYWIKPESQADRIRRLLKEMGPENQVGEIPPWLKTTGARATKYRPFVDDTDKYGHKNQPSDPISIWWDGNQPDEESRYAIGLVLIAKDDAASFDDRMLSEKLWSAFLVAVSREHVGRHWMLTVGFNGKPVWIEK